MNEFIFNLSSSIKGAFTDKEFGKALKYFKKVEKLSEFQKREELEVRVKEVLEYSKNTIPYYKNLPAQNGLSPLEWLKACPILTKDDIRKGEQDLKAPNFNDFRTNMRRSGGTTGEPTRVYADRFGEAIEGISHFRNLQLMGWKPGMSIIRLFGGSLGTAYSTSFKHKIRSKILGEYFLSAFELSSNNIDRYAAEIKKHKKCVIIGYASALNNLAQLSDNAGIKYNNVEAIFSTAEMMNASWHATIREVFNCPVKSYYGCGEVENFSCQIEEYGPYKVNYHTHMVETNEQDEILLTTIHSRAYPLIRYQNGDRGKLEWRDDGLYITELMGRVSDQLFRVDRELVSGSFVPHMVLRLNLPVRKYQVIQREFGRTEFRYLHTNGQGELTAHEISEVNRIMKDILGFDMEIQYIPDTEFDISKSKKHRITVNKLLENATGIR